MSRLYFKEIFYLLYFDNTYLILNTCPIYIAFILDILFKLAIAAVVVPNLAAISLKVSPDTTVYVVLAIGFVLLFVSSCLDLFVDSFTLLLLFINIFSLNKLVSTLVDPI